MVATIIILLDEVGSKVERVSEDFQEKQSENVGHGTVITDGLLSALARLRHRSPPTPRHNHRTDGSRCPSKIHSSSPLVHKNTGIACTMTVASGPTPAPSTLAQPVTPPAGPALRRLHYKATGRRRPLTSSTTQPKVIVMGSSTASDKTINTSTDSAATLVTSVTVTDESLDVSETNDAQPNLIDSQPIATNNDAVAVQSDVAATSISLIEDETCLIDVESKMASMQRTKPPRTAPPHFEHKSIEYDSPAYTKPQSANDNQTSPRPGPARFVFDVQIQPQNHQPSPKMNGFHPSSPNLETPKSPKLEKPPSPNRPRSPKLGHHRRQQETHFKFEPDRRRGSEPRIRRKSPEMLSAKEEVSVRRLSKQLEGVAVFQNHLRRPSQHSVSGGRRLSAAAQIHVTSNPLDSATTTVNSARTTIVVQQPSLSVDYGGCATVLCRDNDDDVHFSDAHKLFFDRYGSPHHNRSQSVKAGRSGERHLLGLPQQRARVASMPNTGVEEEYYRLRHFSITGKGVINRGDSLRSRRSRSNTSVASSHSSNERLTRASAPCSLASSRDSSTGLSTYRVYVLGAPAVGKSSLIGQFMTSEYLHAYDTSIDDESGERSVCVLLANEESEITFLDSPPDNLVCEGSAHGYCVVYSTADRTSFIEAEEKLQLLWSSGHTARRAVILVGNKADLARSRVVTTDEGKNLASSYDSKFIETSVGINHNVDELLVGLLTQIRLKQQHAERSRKRNSTRKNRNRNRSPHEIESVVMQPMIIANGFGSASSTPRKRGRLSASVKVKGLLGKVWLRDSKSKSCENLHVL